MLEYYDVPGAQVAVLHHGEVAWVAEYGVADTSTGAPVARDTRFNVGSVSKVLTAWGVMRLVDAGRIDLDAPVDEYFARWHVPSGPSDPALVTTRSLLSHASGLVFEGDVGLMGYDEGEPLPELLQVVEATPPAKNPPIRWPGEPGSRARYSAAGYALLQVLVEDVSGQPFADFMDAELLGPLEMHDSAFDTDAPEGPEARGHNVYGQPYDRLRFAASSVAGLSTTAADLGRLLAATSEVGPRALGAGVLDGALVHEMLERQSSNDFTSFGLGYERQPTVLGPRHRLDTVKHDGKNRGFAAKTKMIHPTGDGLVVLTNGDEGMKLATALGCAWIMPTSKIIRDERGITEGRWPPGRCMGPFNEPNRWVFWTVVTWAVAVLWAAVLVVQTLRKRRRYRPRRDDGRRAVLSVRALGPLGLAAAWSVTLYTPWIASAVYGAHGMIPFGLLGPGIHGVTLGLVASAVVAFGSALFPKDPGFDPYEDL